MTNIILLSHGIIEESFTNEYIHDEYWLIKMVFEAIANFDSYVWGALGLFIVGLLGVLVYEKSSAGTKQYHEDKGISSNQ